MNIVIATAICISAVLGLTAAILAYNGRAINVRTDKALPKLSGELCEVLYLGSLAPSSHNLQSLRVSVYPAAEKISVAVDPGRRLEVVDPDGRELYISLGCYVRMLMNAFEASGYKTELTFDPADGDPVLYYHGEKGVCDRALSETIRLRHTDKSAYDPSRAITQTDFDALLFDHNNVYYFGKFDNGSYFSGSKGFAAIKEQTMIAYKRQAYDQAAAKELAKWLRFSDKEAMQEKDGLPAEQLGISGIKKSLYYLFTDRDSAQGETFAKQGIDTTEKQLKGCAGFVVITSGYEKQELIECGMKTVDAWMALTRAGISVQPMSYSIEDKDSKKALSDALGIGDLQMILRIGYTSEYGRNNAIRRDLTDYISVY